MSLVGHLFAAKAWGLKNERRIILEMLWILTPGDARPIVMEIGRTLVVLTKARFERMLKNCLIFDAIFPPKLKLCFKFKSLQETG
jgi:hypothetical protein